jgi:hypothetical protein
MKFFEIFKEVGFFKKNLKEMEEELKKIELKGEAGAGLVKVFMDGMQNVLKVEISEDALRDKRMLEDLLASAYNSAKKKAQEEAESKFKSMLFKLKDSFPVEKE